jgi:hypothetical protein
VRAHTLNKHAYSHMQLPDISELGTRRHRMLPQQYESWFVDIVVKILNKVPPQQVAIFYQTSGRTSGVGGAWLDKGFLCQLAARQAGAACVWQKVDVFQQFGLVFRFSVEITIELILGKMILDGPPGLERAGRPGFVDMLCFSKEHRMPASGRGFKTVDVMYRGSMAYHKAMGQSACLAAVDYCARWVDSYTPASNASRNLQEDFVSDSSPLHVRQATAPKDTEGLGALSSLGEPVAVLDPFCGYGSVLAVANCRSVAAYGIDVDPKSCRRALEFTLSTLDA